MAATSRLHIPRLLAALVIASFAVGFTGCHNLFLCEGKPSCPSTGTGTGGNGSGSSTTNYAYVSNSTAGSTNINGYSLSSGTLSVISGFPADLNFVPAALAVSPNNGYLYAADSGTGNIYAYTIGSSGVLNIINNKTAVGTAVSGVSAMDISPDGNYLFALDKAIGILYQFQITISTGLLSNQVSFPITSSQTITPEAVKVSPNGNFVVCSLGTGGDVVFPYSSNSGITNNNFASIATNSTSSGDYALAIDTSNNIYIARTSGVAAYSVTISSSTLTVSSVSQSNLTAGAGPHSVALSSAAGANVYVGNFTDGNISGYSSSSGTLTNLAGSPYAAPPGVEAMGRDSSGKYILALGYDGSAGVQLLTIGSTGALTSAATAASGTKTSVPAVLALTH